MARDACAGPPRPLATPLPGRVAAIISGGGVPRSPRRTGGVARGSVSVEADTSFAVRPQASPADGSTESDAPWSESRATPAERDPEILRWRIRALDLVLRATVGLGAVGLLVLFLLVPEAAPLEMRLLGLGLFAAVGAVALARNAPHRARAWGFLLALLGLAGVTLAARGLEGAGRLFLLVVPLLAAVLVGRSAGYASVAASLAVFAGAGSLALRAPVPHVSTSPPAAPDPRYWLFQGVALGLTQLPVLILVDRFVRHLQETLAAERRAHVEQRRLERALRETAERERRAVGHSLHDGACQELAAAALRCQLLRSSLGARAGRDELAHLEAVTAILETTVRQVHDLARGLSVPEPPPAALASALDDLAERVRADTGIECDLLDDGRPWPEDPETSAHLLRIAQEAVSNALRHGRPGRIEIELARNATGGLRLRVEDDGRGMPADGERRGMGLGIMRHRAERIGGTLTVGPAPSGGTVVTCTAPLDGPGPVREGLG